MHVKKEKKVQQKSTTMKIDLLRSINIPLIDVRESVEWNKKPKWNSLEMDV